MQVSEPANILDEDDAIVHQAIAEAAELAHDHFRRGTQSWKKSDGSPVSDADIAVDNLLKSRLQQARPEYGWLSEETSDTRDRLSRRFVWIVDPIDGTRSFLEGGDNWCVAIALLDEGRPVLGHVLAPSQSLHYTARAGKGARLNKAPVRTSSRTELRDCRMVAHSRILKPHRWQRPWPKVQFGMATSLALRLCMVASGAFDAAVAVGYKNDWDLAAGDLIVHEAGGQMTDLKGRSILYNRKQPRQNGLVASGRNLHDQIISHTYGYKG